MKRGELANQRRSRHNGTMDDALWTAAEAARRLGRHPRTVTATTQRLAESGTAGLWRVGRAWAASPAWWKAALAKVPCRAHLRPPEPRSGAGGPPWTSTDTWLGYMPTRQSPGWIVRTSPTTFRIGTPAGESPPSGSGHGGANRGVRYRPASGSTTPCTFMEVLCTTPGSPVWPIPYDNYLRHLKALNPGEDIEVTDGG